MVNRFPFGKPVEPLAPARSRGGLFVLGSIPSALQVRWCAPGGQPVVAMPVENEPEPFWDGADAAARVEAWKEAVGFRDGWGRLEPAGRPNGAWGRWLDEEVLAPLRATRGDAWLTHCVDSYRVSRGLDRTLVARFEAFARAHGIPVGDLGPAVDERSLATIARRAHVDRLRDELRAARPTTIVTLGEAALRVLTEMVDGWPESELALYSEDYGVRIDGGFEGRRVAWYALMHPRSRGVLAYAHRDWVASRSPGLVAARRRCPRCGQRGLVPIAYGFPSPEMWDQERLGQVVLGGCVISGHDPTHTCVECRSQVRIGGRGREGS